MVSPTNQLEDPPEGQVPTGGHSPAPGNQQCSAIKLVTAPVSGWLIRQRGNLSCLFSNTTCIVHLFLNTKPLESIGVNWGYWENIM